MEQIYNQLYERCQEIAGKENKMIPVGTRSEMTKSEITYNVKQLINFAEENLKSSTEVEQFLSDCNALLTQQMD